ncbi:CDP-alcohol phosphatidyltransferase family protein, partial [bacterium]|nr:CDP-alcohol phosphatidyltransferase family protein [bacterium]
MKSKVRQKYESMHPDRVVTLSNVISILRAFMAFPILYFLREGKGDIALIFILIAIVSDVLDGWLARISNDITDIGKILDPVADKVVIFSVMLYLMFTDRMPAYFFLFLAVRDLTIVLMGVYLLNNRKIAPYSNKLGKIAVTFTSATVLAFIYSDIAHDWVLLIMWITIFFLLISWVQYCQTFISQITRAKKKTAVSDRALKYSKGLKKTESSIASRISLLGKLFRIDSDMLTSIEETLIVSDLGVVLTDILIDRLKNVDRNDAAKLEDILKSEMKSLIKTDEDIPDTD